MSSISEIYKHKTWIRAVRVRPSSQNKREVIYFSEATGGGDDGKIYRLINNKTVLYLVVSLDKVGFWMDASTLLQMEQFI